MKKSHIFAIALIAVLGSLATALATKYALRVTAASRLAVPRKAASLHAGQQQDSSADSDDEADEAPKVIRFANNAGPIPPFLVNDLEGRAISTAELRGKVVIVSFWATWCPPCREEIPEMIELASRYGDKLQVIGVSEDDDASPEEVREFAANEKINYPIVMGRYGISREFGEVPALPTSFLVDTNGKVVQKHVGLYPIAVYDAEIRALLGEHTNIPIETFADEGQIFLKNAANATSLPGVDFKGLTVAQKRLALKRMNTEICMCGCKMTLAQCRINDPSCSTSQKLAAQVIRQVAGSHPAAAASAAR
ncbi:MAG TPA: TlpA disulfide reductase family protein [Candidatus Acidoferrum sp.]|jgi:cytochrome c biogenesis protein CcmG/thiol:disulfide interchange protein DsbE|nr:TlpA disulfide reductase family protein [Candidatus Acidoferrum sp.]